MSTAESTPSLFKRKLNLGKYLFLLPAVSLLLLFFIFPILLTIIFSFSNLSLTGSQSLNFRFIGLENYRQMFKDTEVYKSIVNTLVFLICSSLIGQQIFGFLIAILMKNKHTIFRRVIGSIVLSGWVMPEVVCALCMANFLNDSGTLNSIISAFGGKPVLWLFEFPMLSIIIANAWHGTAFSMLVYQAALDDVPTDIEEAAIVDGASNKTILLKIILPYIKGSIITNMMLNTLSTLGVFGLIYMMTGGGPGDSTTTLPLLMYNDAFGSFQIGYGTAISMILLTIGVILGVLYVKASKVKI
ncbi:carbohydrate ABC transporter permease [Clostridium beijerinckii]|uniref:carbohydrate ABC transporter permease n=1 Tax=Clostridium beijerinckii TaxID=1520 RepID=UPI001570037F|nr:sugar ABC transporter permease [Clostridium beijerinckii]NRT72010.1 multiple sugar transport system permease protein [Clostridium beijerinckii]